MTKLKWEPSFSGIAPEFSGKQAKPLFRQKQNLETKNLTSLEIAERSFAYWQRKAKIARSSGLDDSEALLTANKFLARVEKLKSAK